MRMREIVEHLEVIIPQLELKSTGYTTGYHIENHYEVIHAIYDLDSLGLFQTDISSLKDNPEIYTSQMSKISVNDAKYNKYSEIVNELRTKSQGVVEASKIIIKEQEENVINVKLPNVNDLKDVSNFVDNLDKALTSILFADSLRQEIKITGVDSGSMWFEICLNSSMAVSVIGSASWAALVLKKKYYEVEKIKKEMDVLDVNAEYLVAVKNALDKSIKDLVDLEAKNIISEFKIESSEISECKNRLCLAIKLLADLFKDGCEIHGKLNRPLNVENPFPNYGMQDLVMSKVKQITTEESA